MQVNDTLGVGPAGPLDETTRGTFHVSAGWRALAIVRSGDTQPRGSLTDFDIGWGPGGSSPIDARLYRSGVGTLAVDSALVVNGALTVGSSVAAGTSMTVAGNQVWHAGNFDPNSKAGISHNHDGYHVKVSGDTIPSGILSFGTATRQMLGLWGTQYGVGVQASTTYVRTADRFSIFAGGVHSDTENAPGSGGSAVLTIDSSTQEFRVFGGAYRVYHEGFAPPTGANWSLTLLAWCVARYTTAGGWVILTGSGVASLTNQSGSGFNWVDVDFTSSLGTANYVIEGQRSRSGRDTGFTPGVYLDHTDSTATKAVIVMSGTGDSEVPNDGDILSIKFWQRPA